MQLIFKLTLTRTNKRIKERNSKKTPKGFVLYCTLSLLLNFFAFECFGQSVDTEIYPPTGKRAKNKHRTNNKGKISVKNERNNLFSNTGACS